MQKFLVPVLALVVLVVGVYFVFEFQLGKRSDAGGAPPTAVVTRGDVEQVVDVSGDITPRTEVEIKSEISGRIMTILVREGESVDKGQLLVELDDRDLLDEMASTQTDISIARLQHEKARRDYERAKSLRERNLLSEQQYQDLETAYQLAEKSLLRSEQRLTNVKTRLSRTKIHSPLSGVVLTLNAVVGQVAVGASSVNSGTTLMKVANLDDLIISTHINQIDVARIEPRMRAEFRVDSLPGKKFRAELSSIAPVATVKNNIKGYAVVLGITGDKTGLRPGMTADVSIPVSVAKDVLTVPVTALFRPEGVQRRGADTMLVFVSPNGDVSAAQQREVRVGASNLSRVEIKSGLEENEVVLLVRPGAVGGQTGAGRS
jgi:RND family efflux transporter MFP subunit